MTVFQTTRWATLAAVARGDSASCRLHVTPATVDAFVQLSGDSNPLHLDADVASSYGFERAVAHGMIALGMISRLIGTELPGGGSLWMSQDVRFVTPVLVGDRLMATVTVEQVSAAAGVVALKTEVINEDTRAVVLTGAAKVKIPARRVDGA